VGVDFERELSDVLRSAADQLSPPPVDLAGIRRAGRRRRTRSVILASLAAVFVVGTGIGVFRLTATPGQATGPDSSPPPTASSSTPAPPMPVTNSSMANVRYFYGEYEAPGGPGESHPRAPTERSVTISRHSARPIPDLVRTRSSRPSG
jgi:hypothetical protein